MYGSYTGSDRRKLKRLAATFIVIYKADSPLHVRMMIGNRDIHAIMLNLSEGGMAFITNYNIPQGTRLSIQVILINEKAVKDEERVRPMQINGEIRYNIRGEKKEHRLGICFTQISDEYRRAIANFVEPGHRAFLDV